MFKIDHHVHTSRYSPDSAIEPDVLIDRARAAGLNGVVITEHDELWPADELADLASRAGGLTVLAGVEVSTREGHFLVYGLPDLDEAPPGVALADLLKLARRHGAAVVGAHPFRWGQDFEGLVDEHGPAFDALELVSNNVTNETRRKTAELLARVPMAATGSSDGHEPEVVGCYFTTFPVPIRTLPEFVRALRTRSGRPGHRDGAWLSCGPVA